jgi:hypothetical protein
MWRAPENRPFPYGSIVACDVGPVLVQGSRLNRSTLTVTRLAGDEVGRGDEVILVGGGLFDRDTAPVKGHGQLTSTFIHTNLLGDGRPIAVIGSSDRWLYGVDPCRVAAGEPQPLAFSVPFDAPVGAAAFGDTDGDGFDEIVVSVADGFLYGLRPSRVLAPQTVWDVIPPSASDVDRIGFTNRMSALWTAVPDADSYEVAILRASDGVFMTDGWRDVGPVTSATLLGLELERGIRYLFVVRALSEGERSPDVWSDGVTVDLTPTPVGGCLCTAGTARGGSAGGAAALTGLVALALMAVLPRRRRRRFAR